MARLRFNKSKDGVQRATVKIEFRAGLATLETAVVFAYENVDPEIAMSEIPTLSKSKVVEQLEELFGAKGSGHEFIGEHVEQRVLDAVAERVQELWPDLSTDLPLSQVLADPDWPSSKTSIDALRERTGTEAMSPDDFEEHFGDLPRDRED